MLPPACPPPPHPAPPPHSFLALLSLPFILLASPGSRCLLGWAWVFALTSCYLDYNLLLGGAQSFCYFMTCSCPAAKSYSYWAGQASPL